MDIWEKLYNEAKKEYHPEKVSPFIDSHHVVCAIETENVEIHTGFCIEGASGIFVLCAERVAVLNTYIQSIQTVIKRMISFRNKPQKEKGGMPCGACREFFLQLSDKNKEMEILTDYESRSIVKLIDLMPGWWGWKRYKKQNVYKTQASPTRQKSG